MLKSITVKTKFKSIIPFTWDNIPKLAIITGINGVGKSQLLQEIKNEMLRKTPNLNHGLGPSTIDLVTDDETFKALYIPSNWQPDGLNNVNKAQLDGMYQEFINWVKTGNGPNPFPDSYHRTKDIIEKQTGKKINELTDAEIVKNIPHDFNNNDDRIAKNNHLSEMFISYLSKDKQLCYELTKTNLKDKASDIQDKIIQILGIPPWERINTAFKKYKFGFEVDYPKDDSVYYQCTFTNTTTGESIPLTDLSSGEKMIVMLILWSYNPESTTLNNLILLDEPDAHLHPSMSKLLIKIISDTLVNEYGVQVIMTTHNPSTVTLAPENSIYEMSNNPRLIRKSSKSEAISQLSENLLLVTSSFRVVLVEAKNDKLFYESVYNELVISEDISNTPPLIFKEVSSANKDGGKSAVIAWVRKFNNETDLTSTLQNFVQGLIDKDNDNSPDNNLHVIARYSMENYLLDPIVVFSILIMCKIKKWEDYATELECTLEKLTKLSREDTNMLQTIADKVFSEIESFITDEINKEPTNIIFTNGIALNYPRYIMDHRGHDLLDVFQNCFGKTISVENLRKMITTTQMIPKDLVEIFYNIQNNSYE